MSIAPWIGYENFFNKTELTGFALAEPASAVGFPASNMRDLLDYELWKTLAAGASLYRVDLGAGNGLEADYAAIVFNNLGTTTGTVDVEHSDDDAAFTSVANFPVSPGKDRIIAQAFDGAGVHQYWRFNFTGLTTSSFVGEALIGRRIQFPQGAEFRGVDPFGPKPVNRLQRAAKGHPTSNIMDYVGRRIQWSFAALTRAFVEDETDFTGYEDWMRRIAFQAEFAVYAWNSEEFADEALWAAVVDAPARAMASSLDIGRRGARWTIEGSNED